ncbi:MAG: YhbY family RNA-binding protein [Burkholderiaceae bacterium]
MAVEPLPAGLASCTFGALSHTIVTPSARQPTRGAIAVTEPDNKTLKALAHHLKPVVMIGAAGLTDAVMREIDIALTAHELIKVRIGDEPREVRQSMGETISERLAARIVQRIGHLLVVYRARETKDGDAAGARTDGARAKDARAKDARAKDARPERRDRAPAAGGGAAGGHRPARGKAAGTSAPAGRRPARAAGAKTSAARTGAAPVEQGPTGRRAPTRSTVRKSTGPGNGAARPGGRAARSEGKPARGGRKPRGG